MKKIIKNKYFIYFTDGIKPVIFGLILIMYLFSKFIIKKKLNTILLIVFSSILGIIIFVI